MTTVLDHTIVPVLDQDESAQWYSRVLGLEHLGRVGPFSATRVNDSLVFDFRNSDDFHSMHYAFAMAPDDFEAAFQRVKEEGITYGDSPFNMDNMEGPGMTMGAKGQGKAVYFKDPDGHVLEIKTY